MRATKRYALSFLGMLLLGCSPDLDRTALGPATPVSGSGAVDADHYDWIGSGRVFAFQFPGAKDRGTFWETGGGDAMPSIMAGGRTTFLQVADLPFTGSRRLTPTRALGGRKAFLVHPQYEVPQQVVGSVAGACVVLLLQGPKDRRWVVVDAKGRVVRAWPVLTGEVWNGDFRSSWRPDGKSFGELRRRDGGWWIHERWLDGREEEYPFAPGRYDFEWSWPLGWTSNDRFLVRNREIGKARLTTYVLRKGALSVEREVPLKDSDAWYEPVLAPDGGWVLYRTSEESLRAANAATGTSVEVYPGWPERGSFRWVPGKRRVSFVVDHRLVTMPFRR